MNRGQVKRIRKELERLCKGEKEWDALAVIEREGAVEEFASEWNDLWRGRVRHALRTAGHLEEFLSRIDGFKLLPANADLNFMKALGAYLDGRGDASAIAGMTGLSAPAETLRRELLRLGTLPGVQPKLRDLLKSFALTPETVLQKDYRRLCEQLGSFSAVPSVACASFEALLTRSRKLNSASAVKKKANGVAAAELRALDRQLAEAAGRGLPKPLFDLLAAPVLAQMAEALHRVAEGAPDRAAGLALCAPFSMGQLAGTTWPALGERFRLEAGQHPCAEECASLKKRARSASFEERFQLVNRLAHLLHDEEFEPDQNLYDALIISYQGIFKELTLRRATLPEREQRKVAAVFGPVFRRHLPLFYGSDEDLPFILDDAAAAGVLDPTLALLQTFFAVRARDRAMTAHARAMLKLLPPIGEEDVQSLFENYQEFLTDDPKSVKAMLVICRESGHEIDRLITKGLWSTLLSLLTMNTMIDLGKGSPLLSMVMGSAAENSSRTCKKMLKGMACFAGDPEFAMAVDLARAFPEGKITGAGFGLMARKTLDSGAQTGELILFFASLFILIENFARAPEREFGMPPGLLFDIDPLLRQLLAAGLDALCADKATVARHDADGLITLFDIVRNYGQGSGMERYLLLIGNAAAERMQAGDEAMGKLHASVMDYLAKRKKPTKKGGRR